MRQRAWRAFTVHTRLMCQLCNDGAYAQQGAYEHQALEGVELYSSVQH